MSNPNDVKVSLNISVNSPGLITVATVADEDKVRVIVSNAASNNVILVKGRIIGQEDWDIIATLTGNTKDVVYVGTYDQMELESTLYASASSFVKVILSSFNEAGTATAIGAPAGDLIEHAQRIDFTSNDSTVAITTSNTNKTIDLSVAGLGVIPPLVTLSGVPSGSTDLGTFTGTIIPDTSTIKSALQSLETSIDSLPDPMEYKGLWAADTNTPTLVNGTGNNGDVYQVTTAGSVDFGAGLISFIIGDKAVYNGITAVYEKWDMSDAVFSVNGQMGAVVLSKADVGLSNVDNTSDTTKDSATSTLTNKTLTSPVINSPTGLVKADVGLSNVVNSDTTITSNIVDSTDKRFVTDANLSVLNNTSGTNTGDQDLSPYLKADGSVIANVLKLSPTPIVGTFETGKLYYDTAARTLSAMINSDITMQIGQEEHVLVRNNTGSTILNGKAVYTVGANADEPSVALARSDIASTATVIGLATQDIPAGASGFVTVRGIVHDIDTDSFTSGTTLYLSATTAGDLTETPPTDVNHLVIVMGQTLLKNATTGSIYVRIVPNNRLADLTDVQFSTPLVDQVLKYNGTNWINGPQTTASAGAGTAFFLDSAEVISAGAGPQSLSVHALFKAPTANVETTHTATVNNSTILLQQYIYNTALGGTQIDAGVWGFNTFGEVNNAGGVSSLPVAVRKIVEQAGTITITGTGTSRTATALGSTPFIAGDFNADITLTSLIQTPTAILRIIGFTSSSIVTVQTLSTYTNETTALYSKHSTLFVDSTIEVNNTIVGLNTSQSIQPAFPTNPSDKLSISYYARTTATANRTLTLYQNGTDHASYFSTPLVIRHNDLAGLQGGNSTERYHLSAAQATVATQAATSSLNGYLASSDYISFNNRVTIVADDLAPSSFSLANNQVAAANVTGFIFSSTTVRSFSAHVSVTINATSGLYETFNILGLNMNGSFIIGVESIGDDSGVVFSITPAGQLKYTSNSYTGFTNGLIKFRAIVTAT